MLNNRNMKRFLLYLLLVLLVASSMEAATRRPSYNNKRQRGSNDVLFNGTVSLMAAAFGPSYLFGEIGGSSSAKSLLGATDWALANTRTFYGLGAHVIFPSNVGVKANINYGRFVGDDQNSRNDSRAWSYSANIIEGDLEGLVVLFGGPYDVRGRAHMVYVFGGIGQAMSQSDFIGNFNDRHVGDMVRRTEIAPAIPFGIGYQYRASNNYSVGAEFTYHYYLSDYMDGVHSKFSKSEDMVASFNFTLAYQLYGVECKTCEWSKQAMGVKSGSSRRR